MRSRALTHAVEFKERNVQTEEKLQRVFGNGSRSGVAPRTAIQPQCFPNLPEHQTLCQPIVQWLSGQVAITEDKTIPLLIQSLIVSLYKMSLSDVSIFITKLVKDAIFVPFFLLVNLLGVQKSTFFSHRKILIFKKKKSVMCECMFLPSLCVCLGVRVHTAPFC